MYRVKKFCQKILLNRQVHVKHLFLTLLLGSSIAAFAGLYAKQGVNLSQFTVIESLFSKKDVPAYADSIRYLKATNITTTGATLSWEKTTKDETFTVTLYKKGIKVKSINTSSGTTMVSGLEAGTAYTWKVTGSVNNSTSATASFTTMAGDDVVEGDGPIGQVVVFDGDGFGSGGGSGCTPKLWVKDGDGDGVIFGNTAIRQCDSPGDGYVVYDNQPENDCDDTNQFITTQIVEWVLDADSDGYYTGTPVLSCETESPGTGYVKKTNQLPGDCNDNSLQGGAAIKPGATEIFDGLDNDCDGGIDEGLTPPLPTSLTETTPGFQDYIIPAGITSVSLDVQGAKGGSFGRTLRGQPSGSINGGVGRRINTKFNVDANCEQGLKPGGILRLIVGATPATSVLALDFPLPESQNLGQGGGGGSAILYKAPGSSEWVVLVVAGGGGGAATVYSGQGATTINGLPGIGPNSDANTGQNTQGGKSAFTTTTVKDPSDPRGEGTITTTTTYSGGGGGMLGDAIGNCGGRKGLDAGADGGTAVVCSGGRQGGAGFGAGGTGINGGGGGGGYSGGNGGTIAAGGYGAGSFAASNGELISSANGTNVDNGLITITTSTTANSTSLAINCPDDISINSCSIDAVVTETTLAYSSTDRSITEQDLIAAGGSITKGACAVVATISYIDVEDAASTSTKKIIKRTFTVTDTDGAQATCTQTITVEDKTAPVLTGELPVGGTNINACSAPAGPTEEEIAALYTDGCGGAITVVKTVAAETVAVCGWSVTYNYTIKDQSGNAATDINITYSGSDKTAPVLTGVLPVGGTNINACSAPAGPTEEEIAALYTDGCGGTITVVKTVASQNVAVCGWSVTYNYTIKDQCGNAATDVNITYSGSDKTAPVLTGVFPVGGTNINACSAPAGPSEEEIAALYTDGCGGAITVVKTVASQNVAVCGWSVTYNYTIKDQCGNAATEVNITYSGSDKTAPVLTGVLPVGGTNINACSAPAGPSEEEIAALYTDGCGGAITVVKTVASQNVAVCGWSVTYNYTIKDQCGNAATEVNITYSGSDKTAPVLTGVLPVGGTNINACSAPAGPTEAEIAALYTDGCGGAITVVKSVASETVGVCGWSVTYNYTIKDQCGNAAADVNITYSGSDKTAPVLTGTLPVGQINMNACSAPAGPTEEEIAALYTDGCGGAITVVKTVASQNVAVCGWSVTYNYTIKDQCGNAATEVNITYSGSDKTAPVLTGVLPVGGTNINACSAPAGPTEAEIAALYTDGCGGAITVVKSFAAQNVAVCGWSVTYNYTIKDQCGNAATEVNITYSGSDKTAPVITSIPANITVSCASLVPAQNTGAVVATDNCGGTVTITSADVTTPGTCANRYTIARTYTATDVCGNASSQIQTITVDDQTAPTISGVSVSHTTLWPVNHKMRDVQLNYSVTDNCSGPVTTIVTVESNEDPNGTGDGNTEPDWEIVNNNLIKLRAERSGTGDGRVYTITITSTDGCGNVSSAKTQVMVAHNITAPVSGRAFKIGSTVSFAGTFWDIPGNKHTARWVIDNSTVNGRVTAEPSGLKNGTVTGSYKFSTAGVYKLKMEIIDQNGNVSYANTNGDMDAIVVIYDPNGGNAFGGGKFYSEPGAQTANPSAKGMVSYGFQSNYFKTATYPKGETQMEFKIGDFEFNALNYEYLAISGAKAQFRGSGKIINGQSGVSFIMTVIDGALNGTGIDKIRMKVFNKNTNEVYYDNQPGASDDAEPTTVVKTGSTIEIVNPDASTGGSTGGGGKPTKREGEFTSETFEVITAPNPSDSYFTLTVKSSNTTDRILVRVMDELGRVVEQKENVMSGTTIRFGDKYIPGMYFIMVQQGKNSKAVKLIRR